eukprot:364525-Chlamydomonas_euryale.AAC.1
MALPHENSPQCLTGTLQPVPDLHHTRSTPTQHPAPTLRHPCHPATCEAYEMLSSLRPEGVTRPHTPRSTPFHTPTCEAHEMLSSLRPEVWRASPHTSSSFSASPRVESATSEVHAATAATSDAPSSPTQLFRRRVCMVCVHMCRAGECVCV